jgi:hypothetical protein
METRIFTSVVILSRKMIENLIIEILRKKYPQKVKGNLDIYYNKNERRFHDFTMLVKNLEVKKKDFGPDENTLSKFI